MSDVTFRLALDRTEITLAYARPLAQLSAGLFVPGNMRGVMAAGLAGEVRVRAGRTVEDELLAYRPFSLGNAYSTGSGLLASAGVTNLTHGITSAEPGVAPRAPHAERALRAALAQFDDFGIRSATLPLMETAPGAPDATVQGRALGLLLAGHLRRGSRLRHITVAGLDRDFLAGLRDLLIESGALPTDR